MRIVKPKKDNSVCLHFLIISPGPYFYFISGLYLNDHLEYFNYTLKTLKNYTTGQQRKSHANMVILLAFIL